MLACSNMSGLFLHPGSMVDLWAANTGKGSAYLTVHTAVSILVLTEKLIGEQLLKNTTCCSGRMEMTSLVYIKLGRDSDWATLATPLNQYFFALTALQLERRPCTCVWILFMKVLL